MSRLISITKSFAVLLTAAALTACASSVKTVPFKIQSDPLGAYVMYQVQADKEDPRSYDWIYLGNTPLDTRRAIESRELKRADSFMIRVMKEGYLDQQKAWTGGQFVEESKEKGAVFWNPRLIKAN